MYPMERLCGSKLSSRCGTPLVPLAYSDHVGGATMRRYSRLPTNSAIVDEDTLVIPPSDQQQG
jgi:hypothetical protein